MTSIHQLRQPLVRVGWAIGWAVDGDFSLGGFEFHLPAWWRDPPPVRIAGRVYDTVRQPAQRARIAANIRNGVLWSR